LTVRAIQETFIKPWLSTFFNKLKSYDEFKKALTELLWNPSRQASIRISIHLDKYNPSSGESQVDHYIRYANLASTLDPPMAEINLLAAVTFIWNPQCSRG
jgi:hypothetical protein